ncbi:MAG TPA: hypothetical protein VGV40_08575, partial [Solirubrobacteraceae bacterium]|nr:hypothetical protein [Solirubrobacteraceae bacterium]
MRARNLRAPPDGTGRRHSFDTDPKENIAEAHFREHTEEARAGCPISKALAGGRESRCTRGWDS